MIVIATLACDSGYRDDSLRVPLEPTRSLTLTEFDVEGVAILDTQTVLVTDPHAKQLIVLSLAGEERRIGRPGGGPGEFGAIADALATDSLFVVADIRPPRLTVFGRDGRLVESWPLPRMPMRLLFITGDTIVYTTAGIPAVGAALAWMTLTDGEAGTFFHFADADTMFARSGVGRDLPLAFVLATDGGDGSVFAGSGLEYRLVRISRGGKAIGEIRRMDIHLPPISDSEKAALERRIRSLPGVGNLPAASVATAIEQAAARPRAFFKQDGLATDERGRVWVATSELLLQGQTAIDVFGANGELESQFVVDGVVEFLDVSRGLLVTVDRAEEHEAGLQVLRLYQID